MHTLAKGWHATGFLKLLLSAMYVCMSAPEGIHVNGPRMTNWTSSNHFSNNSTFTESISMIGMARLIIIMKPVFRNLSKRLRQGCISCTFYYRRHFNSCTFTTRHSTLILKVGVVPVYWALKKGRVDCGYRWILLA